MSEETKQIPSLAALGLEAEPTPAEKAEQNPNATPINKEQPTVETITNTSEKSTEENIKKSTIPRPVKGQDMSKFQVVKNVNDIAKVKTTKAADPIRSTMDGLYDLADKGIERTKKELTSAGGRINEAKFKYVQDRYEALISRARTNKRLAEHIKRIEEIIQTDPRFDGISEYEHKGYILFTVAHDEKAGIDDNYFGIKSAENKMAPKPSSDNKNNIEKMTADTDNGSEIYDTENPVILGDLDDSSKNTVANTSEDSVSSDIDNLNKDETPVNSNQQKDEDDEDIYDNNDVDEESFDDEIVNDEDDNAWSDDDTKKLTELISKNSDLSINTQEPLSGFTISKAINLRTAIGIGESHPITVTWPLQFTRRPIVLTPFTGEEILNINPGDEELKTYTGMTKLFGTIYKHTVYRKKPTFETWLKCISNYDLTSLIFAIYVANFKDTNYLTYKCENKGCNKVFLIKKPIDEMLNFPNDKVKELFKESYKKEPAGTVPLHHEPPVRISKEYAISFGDPSLYSMVYEPSVLSDEFIHKYQSILGTIAFVYKFYKIDEVNKQLYPIEFGTVKGSFAKTVIRKIKAISEIFSKLSVDEYSNAMNIIGKYATEASNKHDNLEIKYQIPAAECPHCHHMVEAQPSDAMTLLFTRARLPILAASTPE